MLSMILNSPNSQTKAPKEKRQDSEEQRQEDYYKTFRSRVVLAWVCSNFALCGIVLNVSGFERIDTQSNNSQNSTIYLGVILWSVAGLSLFRFTGACWFLIVRIVSF